MPNSIQISIQTKAIDTITLGQQLQQESTGNAGAFVYFTGTVRDFIDASGTRFATHSLYLEYYPGMCEQEIEKICLSAKAKWDILQIKLIHRVGEINIGEPIVFIGVASAHRKHAFRACEYIIDQLKTTAPFWKQEKLADGNNFWVQQSTADALKANSWDSNNEE